MATHGTTHLWRQAPSKALALSEGRTLARSPGKWLPETRPLWLWWYNSTSEELFHREGAVWTVWRPAGRTGLRCTTRTFSRGSLAPRLPDGLQPVTVSKRSTNTKARITGIPSFATPPATTAPIDSLDDRLQWLRDSLPREAWILDELDLVGDPMDVVRSIQTGDACAISDGSYKDCRGAAGFSIICRLTGASLTGRHTVQGPAGAQSAYRSELSGILGIQKLVQLLTLHYGISNGGVTLACDGLSALQQESDAVSIRPTSDYSGELPEEPTHMDKSTRQRSPGGYQGMDGTHLVGTAKRADGSCRQRQDASPLDRRSLGMRSYLTVMVGVLSYVAAPQWLAT
jgi:hypothetical protein